MKKWGLLAYSSRVNLWGGRVYIIDNAGQERTIVNQVKIGTVSKATLGKTSERRGGAHMGCSERTDTILN